MPMSPKQPAAPVRCGSVRQLACFWLAQFQPCPQPALDVAGADGVDLAEFTGADHVAGLADERIAGVVVRDGEDNAGLLHHLGQFLGLRQVECQWLVADDVEAGLGEGFGDFEVGVVRRGDGDEIERSWPAVSVPARNIS